jgi:hypothetical protein
MRSRSSSRISRARFCEDRLLAARTRRRVLESIADTERSCSPPISARPTRADHVDAHASTCLRAQLRSVSVQNDRIEHRWIAAFEKVLALSGVERGDPVAILSESQSRQVNVHLAELAALALGARPFHIVIPT